MRERRRRESEWIINCQEFEVKVGMMLQRSMLSLFSFAVVVDVVTEFYRESALSELPYADDLVLMSETIY